MKPTSDVANGAECQMLQKTSTSVTLSKQVEGKIKNLDVSRHPIRL